MTASQSHDTIEGKLAELPNRPGVYLMRDAFMRVLYVGKARSLRNRVRSYFRGGDRTPKTRSLVARIANFDVIVTDTEVEAILLENNLIKEHRPRFNVTFRDDKQYLYVKVTTGETYPRVMTTRRAVKDGSRYFGPFASAKSLRQTLKLLNRLFPYRTCNIDMGKPIPRPCLKFYLGLCIAPCTRACTVPAYQDVVDGALRFMEGNYERVLARMTEQMWEASQELDYEQAAATRDRIRAVEKVVAEQKVVDPLGSDLDVVGVARDGREAFATVFTIRAGKMIGREHYELAVTGEETDAEMLDDFVREYYDRAPEVPSLVLTPEPLSDRAVLAAWLSGMRGGRVELRVPQRGPKRKLVDLARRNARETLQLERTTWLNSGRKLRQALLDLGTALNLPRLPRRIECYDISHIQGTLAVGSLVVFEDGLPKSGKYRRFKIKGVAGNDDVASLREVLRRRFKRYAEERALGDGAGGASTRALGARVLATVPLRDFDPEAELPGVTQEAAGFSKEWGVTPDLVLIDGGKGQLGVAREVFAELGLDRPAARPQDTPSLAGGEGSLSHMGPPVTLRRNHPMKGRRDPPGANRQRQTASDGLRRFDVGRGGQGAGPAEPIPLAAIAKQREEIFVPGRGDPILLPFDGVALHLVQRVRDEAHRFAVSFHIKLRTQKGRRSILDEIPGIGPTRKRALLRHFGSVGRLRAASAEEIAAVPGLTAATAKALKEAL
ncbi:MAG: excinuclease ABC subunit UvrC [Actinobacteria bacterium]|nr:excinuclease ABC subunit UvrC [Actinomycetota bacterium]